MPCAGCLGLRTEPTPPRLPCASHPLRSLERKDTFPILHRSLQHVPCMHTRIHACFPFTTHGLHPRTAHASPPSRPLVRGAVPYLRYGGVGDILDGGGRPARLSFLPSFHGSPRIVVRYEIDSVERTVHVRSKGRGPAATTPVGFDGSEHMPTRTRTVAPASPRVPGARGTGTAVEDIFASDGGGVVLPPHVHSSPSDRSPGPS